MTPWTHHTPAEKYAAATDAVRRRGLSYREAADELGTTKDAIAGTLCRAEQRDAGYARPPHGDSERISPPVIEHKIKSKDEAEFTRMWLAGMQRKVIARRFDCSPYCVSDTARRLGLALRPTIPHGGRHTISSYLTTAEHDQLLALARRQGISVARVMRRWVVEKLSEA